MFDEWVRSHAAPALAPAADRLARWRVTPSHVTVGSLGLTVAAATAVGLGHPKTGLALWLVSRVGDGLDGVLARRTGSASPRGGFLDITADMAGYSLMILGFAAARPDLGLVWACILVGYVLSITTTLALAAAAERLARTVSRTNRSVQFTPSVAEGGETTLVYVTWVLAPGLMAPTAWLWCLVLMVSVVQRCRLAWRVLDAPVQP